MYLQLPYQQKKKSFTFPCVFMCVCVREKQNTFYEWLRFLPNIEKKFIFVLSFIIICDMEDCRSKQYQIMIMCIKDDSDYVLSMRSMYMEKQTMHAIIFIQSFRLL